jgi:thiopeptide-type bacteriocin biosynthesis protein
MFYMKKLYTFHPQVVLRTPARPFELTFTAETIADALHDAEFMEAIYLASPILHAECGKWQRGELTDSRKVERLRSTLTRYYVRFMSRCTPFGLFAGCSVLDWGPPSQLEIRPSQHGRHTRLDMHYLCALAQHLAVRPDVQPGLRHWPNTSLYYLGGTIRYIERQYDAASNCTHQISALDASEALTQVLALAQQGPTLPELAAALLAPADDASDAPEAEEVSEFLAALVAAQVLVSELEPTVTGDEFFQHLLAVLSRLATSAPPTSELPALVETLIFVQQALAELDEHNSNPVNSYERIELLLAPLGVPVEAGRLFQTDAHHGLGNSLATAPATLSTNLQGPLLEALTVLAYLAPPTVNPRLTSYTERFQARYQDQEVPLLEALDTESGVPYTDYYPSRYSPLVDDLVLPVVRGARYPADHLNPAQEFLREQLREAARTRTYSFNLTEASLCARGLAPPTLPLPPSLGVLFRLVSSEQLVLESIGGSSAVNLLGRFAHALPSIGTLIEAVTVYEQAQNPDVAFAEISHLPASRVGNLLQRPHFRAREIPYLTQSTRPLAQQLAVQDLVLAVRGGQLVLRERSSGQRIIPRLSTAHNFGADTLPVYQLLGDLQNEGLQSYLGIDWEAIAPEVPFTPRLTCGPIVLVLATWRLIRTDWAALMAASPAERPTALATFRAAWQLPRRFTLADGDNELLVDTDNNLLVDVWLDTLRTRTNVVLKEFLIDTEAYPVRDVAGRPYVAQGIALMLRRAPCYLNIPPRLNNESAEQVQREFALGSEWLYYKLYCGQLVADRVLLDVVRPLAAELQALGLVDRWFFIRYADPDNHLRVRWHLPDPARLGEVVHQVAKYLAPVSSPTSIWKIQTDTYYRELERYGRLSIVATEALFCYQSQALLDYMAVAETTGTQSDPWLWGLTACDELLTAFGYPLGRKLTLLDRLREAFAREFGLDKTLKQQLAAKYRDQRAAVQQALIPTVVPQVLLAVVQPLSQLASAGQLEVSLDDLLSSYLHMLLNRVLPAEARLHELVLYDFLQRHYHSCQARSLTPIRAAD